MLECDPRAGPETAPVFPVPVPEPEPEPEAETGCLLVAVELFFPEEPELELLLVVPLSAWPGEDGEFPMVWALPQLASL